MAEIAGMDLGIDLPSFASSNAGTYILMGLAILVMLIITGGVIYWYFQKKQYKSTITIFENISGMGWRKSMRDTAKLIRLSSDGTEVLFLRKKKIPLTAYGKKMGMNEYWFAIAQDGSYINIVMGDLDAKSGVLDIEPIDRDVKYISVAMRKNTNENYGPKLTIMDKYGSWILGGITIIILFAGLWFLLDQMGDIANSLIISSNALEKATEPMMKALGHIDSICSGGTGLTQS